MYIDIFSMEHFACIIKKFANLFATDLNVSISFIIALEWHCFRAGAVEKKFWRAVRESLNAEQEDDRIIPRFLIQFFH